MTKLIQMEDLLLVARDMGGGRRVMCAAISSGWLEGVGFGDGTVLYLDWCGGYVNLHMS